MAGEEIIPGVGDGGVAVEEAPQGDAVIEDAPIVPAEDAPAPEAGEGDDAAATAKAGEDALGDIEQDGPKLEGKVRAAVAKLAGIDKAAAKEVRDAYFGRKAVMKEFPEAKNLSEAIGQIRATKATLESLGGEEGITAMQTEVEDYRREIQQFADGSRELVEQLYDPKNPTGLTRAARNSLDVLSEKNAEAWDEALAPSLAKYFGAPKGLGNAIDGLLELVKEGKGQEAFDSLHRIRAWIDGIAKKAESLSKDAGPRKDPEREAFEKERQDFAKEKADTFKTAVETDVNKLNNTALARHVDPLVKELKLTAQGKSHFVNGLTSRIWNVLAQDQTYLKQVRAIRSKGNVENTAKFISEAFSERLPEQFKLHRNEIYPNIGSKPASKPAPATNGKPAVKPINIAQGQRPARDQVDWNKTSDTMWIAGFAVLKDGKTVSGFKDAPANRL